MTVRAALLGMPLLAACGNAGTPDGDAPVAVDAAFVDVLAEVHLADARAALAPDSLRRSALADSLRQAALQAHGWTADRFEARLQEWARDPALAVAYYDAVDSVLRAERQREVPVVPKFRSL